MVRVSFGLQPSRSGRAGHEPRSVEVARCSALVSELSVWPVSGPSVWPATRSPRRARLGRDVSRAGLSGRSSVCVRRPCSGGRPPPGGGASAQRPVSGRGGEGWLGAPGRLVRTDQWPPSRTPDRSEERDICEADDECRSPFQRKPAFYLSAMSILISCSLCFSVQKYRSRNCISGIA